MILLICVLAGFGLRTYRAVMIGALLGFITAIAWVLLVVPAVVGLGLTVAFAVAWCVWLDG